MSDKDKRCGNCAWNDSYLCDLKGIFILDDDSCKFLADKGSDLAERLEREFRHGRESL